MRSVELIIVGLMLFGVALVPAGWQDGRFQRFLPGGQRSPVNRTRPRRRFTSLSIAFALVGTLFVVAGFYSMF